MIVVCQRHGCGRSVVARPSEHRKYCSLRCAQRARRGSHTPIRYIVCQRSGCEGIRIVSRPSQQRRGGYCSKRCAALVHENWRHADHAAAGLKSGRQRRARVFARVQGLTSLEAFRLGYRLGLYAKWHALRRKYELVPKARTA